MTPAFFTFTRRDLALALAGIPFAARAGAQAASRYPISRRGNYLFVRAAINGTGVDALLDSGAELSLIDRAFAERIGLIGGKVVDARGSGPATQAANLVEGVTLEAFGRRVTGVTAAVVDLSAVAARMTGPLPLVLGREIFDAGPLAVDIDGATVTPLGAGAAAKGARLPLKAEFGIETMPLRIEGRPAQATFDLGNGNTPLVSRRFAEAAGFLRDGRPVGEAEGGGIGGRAMRRTVTVRSIELAGRRFGPLTVAIEEGDNASDANVGVSILRAFRIVADFPAHALWLEPR